MSRCLVHSQPLDTGMRCAQCDNSLRTGFFAGVPVRISEHVPEGAFFMAKDGKIVDIGLEQARLIAQLTAERDALRVALEKCRELFADIRGDWTDPRSQCREGWRVIDEALHPTSTEGEK